METYENLGVLEAPASARDDSLIKEFRQGIAAIEAEMDDDFNVPKALARIFELAPKINGLKNGQIDIALIDKATRAELHAQLGKFLFDVFGLRPASASGDANGRLDAVMHLVLELRQKART